MSILIEMGRQHTGNLLVTEVLKHSVVSFWFPWMFIFSFICTSINCFVIVCFLQLWLTGETWFETAPWSNVNGIAWQLTIPAFRWVLDLQVTLDVYLMVTHVLIFLISLGSCRLFGNCKARRYNLAFGGYILVDSNLRSGLCRLSNVKYIIYLTCKYNTKCVIKIQLCTRNQLRRT